MHCKNNKKNDNIVLSIALTVFSQNSPSICLVELRGTAHSQVALSMLPSSMWALFYGVEAYISHTECSESHSGVSAGYIFLETAGTTYRERNQNTGMNVKSKSLCVL